MIFLQTDPELPVLGTTLEQFFYERLIPNMLVIALYILIGSLLVKLIIRFTDRSTKKKLNLQSQMLIHKAVQFLGVFVIVIIVMNRLQIPLSAILGTAGIATIAIGIASQNSLGNIISGIFLISEKTFIVGDVIQVGTNIGTVTSIDLLSVKIRNYDGIHLRIPNETLIRTEITTITKNPVRRVPLEIGISYYDDLEHARDVLFQVAEQQPLVLKDPPPFFMVTGYGTSSLNMLFAVWGETKNFAALKTAMLIDIKKAFDREGIEIPFPHVTLRPAVDIRHSPKSVDPPEESSDQHA